MNTTDDQEVISWLREHGFTVVKQGKEFVLFGGLVHAAHMKGLSGIDTELLQAPTPENGNRAIFKATAVLGTAGQSRGFTAHGDATPGDVGKMVAPHFIRMSETRAISRALRMAVNVASLTALEELGDDGPPQPEPRRRPDPEPEPEPASTARVVASPEQLARLRQLLDQAGVQTPIPPTITAAQAQAKIREYEARLDESVTDEQRERLLTLFQALRINGTVPANLGRIDAQAQIAKLEERLKSREVA